MPRKSKNKLTCRTKRKAKSQIVYAGEFKDSSVAQQSGEGIDIAASEHSQAPFLQLGEQQSIMPMRQKGQKWKATSAVQSAPLTTRAPLTRHIPIAPAANGPIITQFQPSQRVQNSSVFEEFITDDYCVDRDSVRRKFGWDTLGNIHHIPVIYRNNDKYCSVRMVDKHILDQYLIKISDNIYFNCTSILSYYVTVPESLLLNEINEFHCDNFYGTMPFKQGDVLVKFEDANKFYDFLSVCSNKLFDTPCDIKRCGFLTSNGKSMLPYIIIDDEKFVPLFYLDVLEGVKFKVHTMKDWNLSYLKFCFTLHGIRAEFRNSDLCRVIALNELIQHLDPDEPFNECWPAESSAYNSAFQPKNITARQIKPWHQHPITVLPVSTVKYAKGLSNGNTSANRNVYFRTISHS